jgi:hypothetical protein
MCLIKLDWQIEGEWAVVSGQKVLKAKSLSETNLKGFLINMAATYSPALWCSTIGHEGLNFSVRNGKR